MEKARTARGVFEPSKWSYALMLAFGCGSVPAPTQIDAATDLDATTQDAGPFNFGDATSDVAIDAPTFDVYVTLDDGGGLFQCGDCTCDGRTHYCDNSSVGPLAPLDDAAGCGFASCVPLPDGCVPADCECLPNANLGAGCACEHASDGDGLIAGCAAP